MTGENGGPSGKTAKRLAKGAAILGSGAIGSQIVYVMALPFATWLYSPEAFGYFGSFSSFAAVFAFIGCLCYQGVFFLVDKPREERALVFICILAAATLSLLGAASSIVWSFLSPEFGTAGLGLFALFLIYGVFPRALMVGFQAATVKQDNLLNATAAQFARTFIIVAIWLVPGLFVENPSRWFLIAGFATGAWAGLAVLLSKPITAHDPDRGAGERYLPPLAEVKSLAKRYWRFPVFEAPAVALRQFTQYGPILLFASFYGPAAAGFVALATQAVSRPATMVTQSLGEIIRKEYGERLRARKFASAFNFMWRAKLIFLVIGLLAGACLAILAGPAASLILPQEWQMATPALVATAPRLAAMVLIRPTVMLASLSGRQAGILLFEVIAAIFMAVSIVASWSYGLDFINALWVYAVSFAILALVFVLVMVSIERGALLSRNTDRLIGGAS